MKVKMIAAWLGLAGMVSVSSFGAMRYVNVSNANPAAPHTSWATASTNIQNAINWANSGDEVWVAPGDYRSASYVQIPSGKALLLRGQVGRAAVINAQYNGPALIVSGTNSVVSGFTVRNGYAPANYGGGIILAAPSTVTNCLVVSNWAYGGAGIHIRASGTKVVNSTIQGNRASNSGGGVMFTSHSTGYVANCEISYNTASNGGGGVYVEYVGAISNCWIADNQAIGGSGGGVNLCEGGRMVNSVVVGNTASNRGGGIYARYGGGRIVHCTVADNSSGNEGGGVWIANTCTAVNNIVYYNVAQTSANFYAFESTVRHNCTVPAEGVGCVTNVPLFTDRATRTLTLQAASPCIDAGEGVAGLTIDYAGDPRPAGAGPDIGAYEYPSGWDAGYTAIGGGWRRLGWFGDYVPMSDWIFHNKHGFWYPAPSSTPQNIWFYTQDMGWLYTSSTQYPFLYRANDGAWLWYNGSTNPRWFRNMTAGTWESWP